MTHNEESNQENCSNKYYAVSIRDGKRVIIDSEKNIIATFNGDIKDKKLRKICRAACAGINADIVNL